jgi:hypothetical protein
MTFDEALRITPCIAQVFLVGCGVLLGLTPVLFIWQKINLYRSEARLAQNLLNLKEEYIQHLQTRSQEERDRFHKLTIGLLELPTSPTDTRLN